MTKRLGRLMMAAAAAMRAFAVLAACRRGDHRFNSGYVQFAPWPAPSPEAVRGATHRMEMIEIQRATHAPMEIKVHRPERPNNSIRATGTNCYVGSSQGQSGALAATATAGQAPCADAGTDSGRGTDRFHEQIQLRDAHV